MFLFLAFSILKSLRKPVDDLGYGFAVFAILSPYLLMYSFFVFHQRRVEPP